MVDRDRNFYFLEMNTRLQVEHPVTEMITGLDLVEQMIRVAAGEKLAFTQKDVKLAGWAIECRIYAEDPFRGFLPSIGRLVKYIPPPEVPGVVRVDTGVYEGGEISMYYDSMIAKLITHGATRDQAIGRMRDALNAFVIRGVSTNIPFQAALMQHPRFVSGRMHTGLIAEEYPKGFRAEDVPHDDPALLVCVAASIHRRYTERAAGISGQMPGHQYKVGGAWNVILGDVPHLVTVTSVPGGHQITYKGETFTVISDWAFGYPIFRGTINGHDVCMQVERRGMHYRLFHWGTQVDVMVITARAAELYAFMPAQAAARSLPVPDLADARSADRGRRDRGSGGQGRREARGDRSDEDGERAARRDGHKGRRHCWQSRATASQSTSTSSSSSRSLSPARPASPRPHGSPQTPRVATTSGGACTSSISTPSPEIGNWSLPFGCTKQMSKPAAPLRMPPGAKRRPFAVNHSTAFGRSSTHSPM